MSAPPTPYERQFNFTSFEQSHPSKPKPGASLDAEFNAVKTALDTTQSRLAQIQRDDGALANECVTFDALDEDLQDAIRAVQGDVAEVNEARDEAAAGALTLSIRIGNQTGAAFRLNGATSGRLWGGRAAAWLIVEEIKA